MTLASPARAAVLLAVLAAAGCSSDRLGDGPPGLTATPTPAPPPVAMAGRWQLASPGRGQCNMTFGAASPTAPEGTIAPAGGCPGQFFTSRKWTFDSTGLVIRNHNGEPLAQLSSAGDRFSGQASTGDPVTLTR
jgi:hypothetical protein